MLVGLAPLALPGAARVPAPGARLRRAGPAALAGGGPARLLPPHRHLPGPRRPGAHDPARRPGRPGAPRPARRAAAPAGARRRRRSRVLVVPGVAYRADQLRGRGERRPPALLPRARRARRARATSSATPEPGGVLTTFFSGQAVPALHGPRHLGRGHVVDAGLQGAARRRHAPLLRRARPRPRPRASSGARARASSIRTAAAIPTSSRHGRPDDRPAGALRLRNRLPGPPGHLESAAWSARRPSAPVGRRSRPQRGGGAAGAPPPPGRGSRPSGRARPRSSTWTTAPPTGRSRLIEGWVESDDGRGARAALAQLRHGGGDVGGHRPRPRAATSC